MPNRRFSELERRLANEGAARRYTKRVIGELDDHAADLVKELMGQGLSRSDAELQARKKIGDDDALAQEIMSRPFARSFVARYPYVAFTLGPFGLGALVLGATLLPMISFITWGKSNFDWSQAFIFNLLLPHHYFLSVVLVPALAVLFCWLAYTRSCSLYWAFSSTLVLAFLGSLLFDTTLMPPSELLSEGHYSVTFYWNGYVYSYWRLFAPLMVFAGYAGWLRLRATQTT